MKWTKLVDDNFLAAFAASFKKPLRRVQGDSVRALAAEAERHEVTSLWQFAYILGTCWHESWFVPQKEKRARVGTTVWEMQEKYWHTGFYGRGLIQLTHERNYLKFGKIRDKDFVKNPDAVMQIEESAFIAVHGMVNGLFTGRKLSTVPEVAGINTAAIDELLARHHFPFLTSKGKVRNKNVLMPTLTAEFTQAHSLFYARMIVNGTFHALQVAQATVRVYKILLVQVQSSLPV